MSGYGRARGLDFNMPRREKGYIKGKKGKPCTGKGRGTERWWPGGPVKVEKKILPSILTKIRSGKDIQKKKKKRWQTSGGREGRLQDQGKATLDGQGGVLGQSEGTSVGVEITDNHCKGT